jgi:Protein kinase domain
MSKGPSGAAPDVGSRLGAYVLERCLGRGGEADVFLGRDLVLRRPAAIKVLHGAAGDEPNVRGLHEARLLASLEHPHIVRIYHVGLERGAWFSALEYAEGGSLAALLKQRGALPPRAVVRLATAACDALAYAHGAGLVHRDIKPQNLLLTREGALKLADFGLATVEQPRHAKGERVGSPHYMAPEVWRGEAATYAADLYGLGASLHALLTRAPPFDTPHVDGLAKLHCEAPPPAIAGLPPALAEVLRRLLAKRPQDRPSSALEARTMLARVGELLRRDTDGRGRPPAGQPAAPTPSALPRSAAPTSSALLRAAAPYVEGSASALLTAPPLARLREAIGVVLRRPYPLTLLVGPPGLTQDRLLALALKDGGLPGAAARLALRPNLPWGQALALAAGLSTGEASAASCRQACEQIAREVRAKGRAGGEAYIHLVPEPGASGPDLDATLALARAAGRASLRVLLSVPDGCHAASVASPAPDRPPVAAVRTGPLTSEEVFECLLATSERNWTRDAADACAHLHAVDGVDLSRLVQNALALCKMARLPMVNTWCVFGAVAHPSPIESDADVLAAWRERPTAWPTAEVTAWLAERRASQSARPVPRCAPSSSSQLGGVDDPFV